MRDLLIITPTRGRAASAQRLIDAVAATATAATDLILAVDRDDVSTYAGLTGEFTLISGPRKTCPEWSNQVAVEYAPRYRALASLGDDHVPETPGWDTALLAALDSMGGTGIAYGDDTLQHDKLPTAPVVSSDIVQALGWLFLPGLLHYYPDDVWRDLAAGAGCLAYVPDVTIRHLHYTFGTAVRDETYAHREATWAPDEAAYRAWRRDQMPADVAAVRSLRRTHGT